MATIAIFIALGLGTAWALEVDSVRSKHIVNEQVKGADVGDDALTRKDIVESSVEPDALGAFHDAPMAVPDPPGNDDPPREGQESVLTLDLPAGDYFIVAKGQAQPATAGTYLLICRLYADGDFDEVRVYEDTWDPFVMTVLASAAQPFTADLACTDRSTPAQLADLKINAIPVRRVFNTPK
jgi:hypothetical protein